MNLLAILLEPSGIISAFFGIGFTVMGFFMKSYFSKIDLALAELKNDIKTLNDKFDDMKERLVVVETTQGNCKACNS